jgi:hypothetical protein
MVEEESSPLEFGVCSFYVGGMKTSCDWPTRTRIGVEEMQGIRGHYEKSESSSADATFTFAQNKRSHFFVGPVIGLTISVQATQGAAIALTEEELLWMKYFGSTALRFATSKWEEKGCRFKSDWKVR